MNDGPKKNRLCGVVLAAGFSSRMSRWKMELEIKDRPLLYYTLSPMLKVCESIIIVGGYSIEKLSELLESICSSGGIQREKIRIVENERFQKGMFSSVKKGLLEAGGDFDGIFIMPGDMPFVRLDTYKKLATALDSDSAKNILFPTALISLPEGGLRWKKGHPVLIRGSLRELIIRNEDDAVFRDVLKPFSFDLCQVKDEGICFDIDDEADLNKALSYIEKNYKYSGESYNDQSDNQ